MSHASASRPHHMLVVVTEHPGEELTLVRTTALLRRGAEVSSLFRDGQLAVVGDAEFDSWNRVEVVLIRGANLVNVLPLSIAPPIRRVLHELVVAVAVDLGNEAESTVQGLGVWVASERTEGAILW